MPPVWGVVFRPVADLLRLSARDLGWAVEESEREASAEATLNVILGWPLYEPRVPRGARYVVHQLEPLHLPPWPARLSAHRSLFAGACEIWDYSEAHLALDLGAPVRWMPLRRHPGLTPARTEAAPEWDVLFTGHLSPRRQALLRRLSDRCCVAAQPRWGGDLVRALTRSKVVLNLHQWRDQTPLEQPRVAQALQNGAFVVSERSVDAPYPGLVTAPYDRLAAVVLDLLHDSRERAAARQEEQAGFVACGDMRDALSTALRALGFPGTLARPS
jgi:hypothetical protein